LSNQPDWTFRGAIAAMESKPLKSGKNMTNIVIVRRGEKWDSKCVCTMFGDLPGGVEIGAEVEAEGYMNGREYNGRPYAGLKVSHITPLVSESRMRDEQATAGQAETTAEKTNDLPF
jgi:hypothetical protein